jgi:hypothetical protein
MLVREGIKERLGHQPAFLTVDIGPNTGLGHPYPEHMLKYSDVEVIVIEEILRDKGYGRTQGVGHGEQQNSGHRRLV